MLNDIFLSSLSPAWIRSLFVLRWWKFVMIPWSGAACTDLLMTGCIWDHGLSKQWPCITERKRNLQLKYVVHFCNHIHVFPCYRIVIFKPLCSFYWGNYCIHIFTSILIYFIRNTWSNFWGWLLYKIISYYFYYFIKTKQLFYPKCCSLGTFQNFLKDVNNYLQSVLQKYSSYTSESLSFNINRHKYLH
jgi:hypothetical protein